jgi:hypothetical protein
MNTATFNALPVMTTAAAVAGGVAIGSYFITPKEVGQTGKRVTYHMRIAKIRENATYIKTMPRTNNTLSGWMWDNIGASGSWPDGAIDYDTNNVSVSASVMPDFPAGTSQQTDGYVRIYDILTD